MRVDDFDEVLELSVTNWFVIYHYPSVAVVYTFSDLTKNGEGLDGVVNTFVITFRENLHVHSCFLSFAM